MCGTNLLKLCGLPSAGIANKLKTRLSGRVSGKNLSQPGYQKAFAGAVIQAPSGRPVLVVSIHLPWGGQFEAVRLQWVQFLNEAIQQRLSLLPKDAVAVLAGDFNTTAESDTVRWLTGMSAHGDSGALWVDAWKRAGQGEGFTSVVGTDNESAIITAKSVGITYPERIPPRRIDYILIHGWAYGQPGDPYSVRLLGTKPTEGIYPSDHYGLVADLADPPQQ